MILVDTSSSSPGWIASIHTIGPEPASKFNHKVDEDEEDDFLVSNRMVLNSSLGTCHLLLCYLFLIDSPTLHIL